MDDLAARKEQLLKNKEEILKSKQRLELIKSKSLTRDGNVSFSLTMLLKCCKYNNLSIRITFPLGDHGKYERTQDISLFDLFLLRNRKV